MAKKKSSKKDLTDPRKRRKESKPGFVWTAAAIVALLGAIVQLATVGLSNWRVAPGVTYHYLDSKDQPVNKAYSPSAYGLYLLRFNQGASVTPWYILQQRTCTAAQLMEPLLSASSALKLWDATCDSTCVNHFLTRCQIYGQQSILGYATIGVITLGAVAALVAVGWFFIVGLSPVVFQVCWTGSSACSGAMLVWWVWSTDYNFGSLRSLSQFPYPSLAAAFYACSVGVFMVFLAGITSSVGSWMQRRAEWAAKQEAIRSKIIKEDGDFPLGPSTLQGLVGGPAPRPGGPGGPGGPTIAPPSFPFRPQQGGMPPPSFRPPGFPPGHPGGGPPGLPPGFRPPYGFSPPPARRF